MRILHSFLLYVLILLIPVQLGKHYFPDFSYISGVPIDYLAPTLYLTDLIALLMIFLNLRQVLAFFKNNILYGFIILLCINVVFSISQPAAIYKSIRILEMLSLFAVFKHAKLNMKYVLGLLAAGALFEISLAVAQVMQQSSLQGIFYFFGERNFTLSSPSIAKASINGVEMLRPYATFSHPNSLAGFYLLIYFFVFTFTPFRKYILLKNILLLLCSMLILISFSKIAIAVFLLLNIILLLNRRKIIGCNMCVFGRIFILIVLSAIFLSVQGDINSLEKRLLLADNAVSIFLSQPVVGVGVGNYLFAQALFPGKYPYFFLQPVHNIFLLFLAEGGLLLTLYTGYFLYKWLQIFIKHESFLYAFAIVVVTGMADHYWLTLQQNMLLLPVVFGIIVHGQTANRDVK